MNTECEVTYLIQMATNDIIRACILTDGIELLLVRFSRKMAQAMIELLWHQALI